MAAQTYETGMPCIRGHISPRYVKTNVCCECNRELTRKWRKENADRANSLTREWRKKNLSRARQLEREYRQRNRDAVRVRASEWYRSNKASSQANKARRRSRKLAADGAYSAEEIRNLFCSQGGKCAACAVSLSSGYHVDHVIPLARGGSNWISNIQLLCAPCNLSKGAKTPIEWAQSQGRLL